MSDEIEDAEFEDKGPSQAIAPIRTTALEAIVRGGMAMSMDAAHARPRSLAAFRAEVKDVAKISANTAKSCFYLLKGRRDETGKPITGYSIRFAEIAMAAYRNLRIESRLIEVQDERVVVQAVCTDTERNISSTQEYVMQIVGKNGRYSENMISTTIMAAQAKARRNAILGVIPRAYLEDLEPIIRDAAAGHIKDLTAERKALVSAFKKDYEVELDQILQVLDRKGIEEVTTADIGTMREIYRGLKEGDADLDHWFPKQTKADGIKEKLRARKAAQPDQAAATTPAPPPPPPPAQGISPPPPPASPTSPPPPLSQTVPSTAGDQAPSPSPASSAPPQPTAAEEGSPPERPRIRRGGGPGTVPPPVPSHQSGLPD